MAWEWSHTAEALINARENLEKQDREWLEECYAEIQAKKPREYGNYDFELNKYNNARQKAKEIPFDILCDAIWEFAEEYRTCTNGGHEFYMCPFGCHAVSCSNSE